MAGRAVETARISGYRVCPRMGILLHAEYTWLDVLGWDPIGHQYASKAAA